MLALLRSGLSELAPSCTSTYLSIPEVPTPLGLLSPMRGLGVSSLALVEIPIQLGMAWVARWAYGCLPLFLSGLSLAVPLFISVLIPVS